MFKTAGDILALGLWHGLLAQSLCIYGLAVNYTESTGIPMKLDIDFQNTKARFYALNKAVGIYDGVQWLLNTLN